MPTTTNVFTSNASIKLADLRKARIHTQYVSLILAYGTFGGGTLSFYLSPDGGTTKVPLTSTMGGTGLSCTSNAMAVITLGTPSTNLENLSLYATMAGATSPSVTVKNYDNNN